MKGQNSAELQAEMGVFITCIKKMFFYLEIYKNNIYFYILKFIFEINISR